MKKSCLSLIALAVHLTAAFTALAAPIPSLGPVDVRGTVSDVRWLPDTMIKGVPGMSGSAGKDRTVAAHFIVTLADFTGIDAATAITMTRYLDWYALKDQGSKQNPPFILLKINQDDKNYLRKGMNIKVSDYKIRGDEGGTWTSFNKVDILSQPSPEDYLRRYLETSLEAPGFGGKMFCTYELYGKEPKGNKQQLYLWAFCMEYYLKQGILQEGAGASMPVVLIAIPSSYGDLIETHFKPVDGEDYGNRIRTMFPQKYLPAIFAEGADYNRRAETLQRKAKENARIFYNIKLD